MSIFFFVFEHFVEHEYWSESYGEYDFFDSKSLLIGIFNKQLFLIHWVLSENWEKLPKIE